MKIQCGFCLIRYNSNDWALAQYEGWREMGANNEAIVCPPCLKTEDLTKCN